MLNSTDVKALLEPTRLVAPDAWVGHIPFAGWLVNVLKPDVLVELGTHSGNSYCAFCQTIAENNLQTKAYAVDTWQGEEHAGRYDESVYLELLAYHEQKYKAFSTLLRMTFDQALDHFSDGTVDLLHIDGLHTYSAVKHDFETWLPKLSRRGIVLFHDTSVFRDDFGVHRFWAELQQRYPAFNFTHSNGLGVLLVGPDCLLELAEMAMPSVSRDDTIRFFARLGHGVQCRFALDFLQKRAAFLTDEVNQRDAKTIELYNAISEREAQIHKDQAEIRRLVTAYPPDGSKTADLNKRLEERVEKTADLHRSLAEQDKKIAELQRSLVEQNEKFQVQLNDVLCSRSWRLTAPLRRLSQQFQKIKRLNPVRVVIGIYSVVRLQVRQHGFRGFVRRIPYYSRNFRRKAGLVLNHPVIAEEGLFGNIPANKREIRLHPDLAGAGVAIVATVSVVIPTLNAGPEFAWLLRKLVSQKGIDKLEIVVVDSGSSDDTVATACAMGCTVVEIPPSSFSHSYARNRGAEAAAGDYFLFMVQDAYPIGDYWIYGMLRYLIDHADQKLVAASCAEYCRSDSDMMYDSMVQTHYLFLGCLDYDRIGSYSADDHMSLRSQGQLSDVSCLISSDVFNKYKYRGDYAEDLDLGIRLIKDGYRVAMLASVKVIHSHNRPAYYYLKRSFVDVIFLVGLFDDFQYEEVVSPDGLLAGIISVAGHLSRRLNVASDGASLKTVRDHLAGLFDDWRSTFASVDLVSEPRLSDERLDAYVRSLRVRFLTEESMTLDGVAEREARRFLDAFLARLDHFKVFVSEVYGVQDAVIAREVRSAIIKIFAATAGASLAFMYLSIEKRGVADNAMAGEIYTELRAGV